MVQETIRRETQLNADQLVVDEVILKHFSVDTEAIAKDINENICKYKITSSIFCVCLFVSFILLLHCQGTYGKGTPCCGASR